MPNYGLWNERDLALDALAAGVDREALLDAQLQTVATHNEQINRFLRIFCEPTTDRQISVRLGASNRLQPLDENGRPVPVKAVGNYIVGFPIWKGGTAEAWNFWTHEQMTILDFANSLDLMLQGDVNWMRDQLFANIFYNGAGLAYHDDQNGENFTVFGLANGDAVIYDKSSGPATDSHYAFQAAAIDTANNPFPALYDEITEHPVNAGSRVVAFVSPALVASIKLLADFAPAAAFVPVIRTIPGSATAVPEPNVAPELGIPLPSTMTFIGTTGNTFIVSWQSMAGLAVAPIGYIIGVAVNSRVKPFSMRQYPQAALQGLINQGEPMSRFPFQQSNYVRAAGFGARNRVGAAVVKVGIGSYAAPVSWPFPLG